MSKYFYNLSFKFGDLPSHKHFIPINIKLSKPFNQHNLANRKIVMAFQPHISAN